MPDSNTPPNILAVRFSSIGDILLTTPLLRAIRQRHPDARLTVLTKQVFAPLLSHNPHVTRVIGLKPGQALRDVATELRQAGFSHQLDLHGSVRSIALRALVRGRWSTYPKHRVARSLLIATKRNFYRDRRPVPERYFAAARSLEVTPDRRPPDFFLSTEAEQEASEWLGRALPPGRTLIALAPGAAHATKRWPLEYWRMLVRQLIGEYNVLLVGGSSDRQLGEALLERENPHLANAVDHFGLQGTGALLRRAAVVVSGDTGVMHMATAVGTPVVALFGPTVLPFGFGPYTQAAMVLERSLSCRPCTSQGSERCPLGHHLCLREIAPDTVYDAIRTSVR